MASNPNIPQGTVNRLRGSVEIPSFPSLNITAPYLGERGITLDPEGNTVEFLKTMTGAVTSLEPYQMVTIEIALLKTQGLADQYKQQIESSALLGDINVRTDSSALSSFQLSNCAIESVDNLPFNGKSAEFGIKIRGYWQINSSLWSLT